ncbi:MAG: hypothetical protein WAS07_14130 [Micropruina sp.]
MKIPTLVTPELQKQYGRLGRLVALAGALLFALSPYLPWAYPRTALDNMTYLGAPSTVQFLGLSLGVLGCSRWSAHIWPPEWPECAAPPICCTGSPGTGRRAPVRWA